MAEISKQKQRVGSRKPYSGFSSIRTSNYVGVISLFVPDRASAVQRGVGSPLIATQVTKANEAK